MRTRLTSRLFLLLLAFAVVMLIFPAMAFAQGAPTMQSDKVDYAPGETVTLSGANWQPGESVHINVNDNQTQPWSRDVDVTADANGDITDQFQLPTTFAALYNVTATGSTSGTATTTFTDGNMRFRTQSLSGSGNVEFDVTYTKYTASTSCQGNSGQNSTGTVKSGFGASLLVGVDAGQSVKLTAPSPEDTQTFVDWTGSAGSTFTTSGTNDRAICVTGSSNGYDFDANYTTDSTAPQVVSINRSGTTNPTNTTNPVNWTVTFSESVTNVGAQDFSLANTGLGGTPAITTVSGSGATRTVTASTGSGDGTLGLNLDDDDTIVDASRNKLAGSSSADGSFTGQVYTIDRTAPKVDSVTPTENATTVPIGTNVDAKFLEANDMNASTITNSGSNPTFTLRQGGSSGTVVTTTLNYDSGTKTVTLDPASNLANNQQYTTVLTNGIRDAAGNALVAKTWSFTTALACTAPSVTTQPSAQSITYGNNASFTASASGTSPSVNWQKSTDGTNWTDISGATSNTLTLTKPPVSDSGNKYRAVFTNSCGSATSNPATLTIAKKNLTISGAVANSRTYDGTVNATVDFSGASLVGVETGDSVSIDSSNYSASFGTKDVGQNKTVSVTGVALGGSSAVNYSFSQPSGLTANITSKGITGSFAASNKAYDGNASATVSGRSLNGTIAGDTVSLTGGTATFADKNVGTGKTVTLSGASLTGTDAGNYNLTSVGTTTADITAKTVTGSFTASNKVYDGNTSANVTAQPLQGVANGDTVNLQISNAQFDNKNVGTGKDVTADLSLTGAQAGNYSLSSQTASAKADISAKSITGSFSTSNKVYDGNTSAVASNRALNGTITGDNVSLSGGTANFADKNVGVNKVVELTGATLAGTDAGNYTLASVNDAHADITRKDITGSFSASNKVYDGNTSATVTGRSLSGDIAGDTVSLSGGTASFGDKNVGTGKTVTLTGATLAGTDAGNYNLTSVGTAKADITKKGITDSFTASNKIYDGNTDATVTGRSLNGAVTSDAVSLSGGTASFGSKTAGTGKTVTLTGATLAGADAGNYNLTSVGTTTANITPKPISGSFTAQNKVYDGTTAATVTGRSLAAADKVGTDDVSLTGGTASFDNKNVGTGKTVTLSGASLIGTDAGNYNLTSVGTATADITVRPITVTAYPQTKVYGQADPNLTYKVTSPLGLAQGDSFSGALTRDPGETVAGSPYAITQGTLSAGSNYNLSFVGANLTITAANTTTTVVQPNPTQYSDVVTLTANVTGPGTPTGTVQFKINGSNVGTPQALSGGSASLPYTVTQAPNSYQVTAVFNSSSSNWNNATSAGQTLTVKQENAKANFSGATFYAVPSGSANVTLSATITDDADGNRGDIRNAKVTFTNMAGTPYAGCSNLPVGLINTGDTTVGAATCNTALGFGTTGSTQYDIRILVSGHYVDNNTAENSVVTVSQATSGMITGGGFLVNQNSSGLYAGDTGQKTNFGFNVKYNNSGTNLQGNINTIIRRGGRVYQIKGNSMTSLSNRLNSTGTGGASTFNGKASIQDITNPLAPISVDGNASLQVTITDNGEPGSSDTIGITVWNKSGGLWFSSNWSGTKTLEQLLSGGNLVVR